MSRVISRSGNVISVDFTPRQLKKHHSTNRVPTGVFIKPSGADTTMFTLRGNVAGFIASYIAFHPEFSPALFGAQVREELGLSVGNDWQPDPPRAA